MKRYISKSFSFIMQTDKNINIRSEHRGADDSNCCLMQKNELIYKKINKNCGAFASTITKTEHDIYNRFIMHFICCIAFVFGSNAC